MTKLREFVCLVAAVLLLVVGCSGDGSESVGSTSLEVAPAGSNAQFISSTMPASLFPGERRRITVTMLNNGTTPGTNNWTTSAPTYALATQDANVFGWAFTPVTAAVAVGAQHTFSFVITAPNTAGSFTFSARMRAIGLGDFGQLVSIPVNVSAATTPQWGCTFVSGSSNVPTTLAPGENRAVTVVVQNSGTATWGASGFFLASRDVPVNLWGQTNKALTSAVAPGATTTFNFTIKAPSTAGNYTLKRDMRDTTATGVGDFRLTNFCVDLPITVGGTPPLDATLVSEDFPTTMAPSDSAVVTVVMQNTGTETWQADGNYRLFSLNNPVNLWGTTSGNVTAVTAPGASATITMTVTAPATPGNYTQVWQMRKISGANAGSYGQIISVPVLVDGAASSQFDASVVSQTIPTLMTVGKPYQFAITMQNDGTASWSGTAFGLYSTNSPTNLWGVNQSLLGAAETVATGGQRLFTINVTAPATAGSYASSWRMRQTSGVGFFGDTALTPVEVTLCGNALLDAGEQCDDNNLDNGDGCSEQCQNEATQVVVDLATDAVGRTLIGSSSNQQLGPVKVGDISGEGTPDVIVSQLQPPTGINKGGAGGIYAYSGAGFLNGSTSSVPTGATLQIAGAGAGDGLGAVASGRIVVGDVTGDGVADLIVSAPRADGDLDARVDAGEVYVLAGGAGLLSAGLVDLGATTPPAQLTARIIGATAGQSLVVLATGDLTGDGVGDLLLGAPGDDTAGTNAGAAYVVAGGAGLTGNVDLAAPTVTVRRILGGAAGDAVGSFGAVGDIGGTTALDVVLGVSLASPGGRTRAGSAFAIFGSITADRDLGQAVGSGTGPSVAWHGQNNFDGLGSSVAIGNVLGSTANEVVLGAIQYNRSPGVQSGAALVFAGAVAGGTYDLSGAATATSTILGPDQFDDCGSAIVIADTNNDARGDVIMACSAADGPGNTRASSGEVHVVLGAATMPATKDLASSVSQLVMYSAGATDFLSRHVTSLSAADVNGDGKADFCGGAYLGGDGALSSPGRVDCYQSAL